MIRAHAAELRTFLRDQPNSDFVPAVRSELASHEANNLHFDAAISLWRANVAELLPIKSVPAQQLVNQGIALYTRHLLVAGKMEELVAPMKQFFGRVLDDGPLSEMFEVTRQKYVATLRYRSTIGMTPVPLVRLRQYGVPAALYGSSFIQFPGLWRVGWDMAGSVGSVYIPGTLRYYTFNANPSPTTSVILIRQLV